jgi:two-component system cell cycle sensor histidine kinase/response regulator CckA
MRKIGGENQTMRILLIDDSPYDRELIKRTLQRNFPDASFVEVLHEQAFDEALQDLDYTLACTDYYLKWTTGLEILRAIRARSTDLPVIMVTDTGSEEIAAEAMRKGLDDYVLKSHLPRLPIAISECLERRRMQAEQHALQAQLQQVQKLESLGLLVSGVAHDFNNVLAGIKGYAELGMKRTPPAGPPFDEYFRHIHARAEHGAQVTRKLLAFARGTPIEPQHIFVNERITALLDLIRTLVGPSIQVTFHADPDVQAIYADPTQLEQVLMNLCLNARDAMPTGGSLEISTQRVEISDGQHHGPPYLPPGVYTLIRVRDTGAGMDEQTQAHLFEPFFTTKDVGQGTGLGLAVAYGIVKEHRGAIRVQSQPGEGSTFSLYFPVAAAPEKPVSEQPASEQSPICGGSETILLIEDDPDIQAVLEDVLQEYGYTVVVASDGEAGTRIFDQQSSSFALVIADIMMPKMQGRSFQDHVHSQRPDVKVLIISGYQEADLKRRNLLDPRSAFLQKPFDLDAFAATARRLLGGPES